MHEEVEALCRQHGVEAQPVEGKDQSVKKQPPLTKVTVILRIGNVS